VLPIPGGWSYRDEAAGATIILDYIYPNGRGLEAWVELRVDDREIPLASGRQDLTLANAAAPFLRAIPDWDTTPWSEGLRLAFYEVINADRNAAATIDLTTIEPSGLQFLVDPLVEAGGATRLIAPGGAGKSLFAMAMALTVVTGSPKFLGLACQKSGPVIYLDWETNADTHAQRLAALCGPLGTALPDRNLLMYRNERTPISRGIRAITRAVRSHDAIMVIVDSAKMAAGPTGQSSGEEATLSMFAALRELGVPALIVDHKSKEDIAKGRRGGYGSVFNDNISRMVWEFTSHNPVTGRFVLELTKENNVGPRAALGFEKETKGDDHGITWARFTLVDVDKIVAAVDESMTDRALLLFQTSSEPMSVGRMAEMLEAKQSSLRAALGRDTRFIAVSSGKGRPSLWRPRDELLAEPLDDGIQDAIDLPVSDWREGPDTF
jgi:hypothetical protein